MSRSPLAKMPDVNNYSVKQLARRSRVAWLKKIPLDMVNCASKAKTSVLIIEAGWEVTVSLVLKERLFLPSFPYTPPRHRHLKKPPLLLHVPDLPK